MRFSVFSAIALSSTIAAALPADDAPKPTAAPELVPRADALAPWVSVDDNGQPNKTYTPSVTTISGSTSLVDPARHDLTASVFTWTTWENIITSTGSVPNPTATGKHGEGSFSLCSNKEGDHAPFCHPYPDSTLLTGNSYYITWDPIFFNKTGEAKKNATALDITVRLDYRNKNDTAWVLLKKYEKVPAQFGFFTLPITKELHKYKTTNVTITLLTSPFGHTNVKEVPHKLPIVIKDPANPEDSKTELPTGIKLAIALPVIFGGIFILLIGVCLWNRKTRRIQLGNIMSRSRDGYSGRRERRQRFDNSLNTGGIQLDNGPLSPPADGYRDEPPTRPRRDSDGLGSLAGSPVDGSFEQQGTTGGRNAFRDEMARQHAERHDDRY